MQLTPTGDSAVRVEVAVTCDASALDRVALLARAITDAKPEGVTDVVAAFATITVHYDVAVKTFAEVRDALAKIVKNFKPGKRAGGREHVVPVCYGGEHGPDLADVARHTGLAEAAVIAAHSGARYRVAAVGFAPGFPYLFGLPAALHTPRRATPRTRVPAGSVGIGGAQTGVYPQSTPGGWNLIGRTAAALFDPANDRAPALLAPGDTVTFQPVDSATWTPPVAPAGADHDGAAAHGRHGALEIVRAGALTTVQDLGRGGRQRFGIAPGGAMDRLAARVANLLLGNPEDSPVLEGTATGPVLKFHEATWIAVTGAEVDGVPGWRPLRIEAGGELSLANLVAGARVYVAVAGGLIVPRVQGGAGPLPGGEGLRAGARLRCGLAGFGETRAGWAAGAEFRATPPVGATTECVVRFVRDAQLETFNEASARAFVATPYVVTAQSDRMGIRFRGIALERPAPRELLSEGVVAGTVQVPPDGQPIVLMADRQTIGGYPKIGHVITVDLPKLAQARTGDAVRFVEISLEDAQAEVRELEKSLTLFRAGVKMRLR